MPPVDPRIEATDSRGAFALACTRLRDLSPKVDEPRNLQAFSRADARTRTGDPFITSEVLYQLSYVGEAEAV
jgi:hypothetical protein